MVDGHLQKSELTEEFHSRLSTQALCPHVGHLLIGICSPVCLGHLSKARKWKSPMHPFHPQQAEPGLCSHMVLIIPREHQKQLFSPKESFWGNCWTGGVRQGLYGKAEERPLPPRMAHAAVGPAEVTQAAVPAPGEQCRAAAAGRATLPARGWEQSSPAATALQRGPGRALPAGGRCSSRTGAPRAAPHAEPGQRLPRLHILR